MGETLQRLINKSPNLLRIPSPHSSTRKMLLELPTGLIISTGVGRRLICCCGAWFHRHGDSSHPVPGQSQGGVTGSHTDKTLQLISLMSGAKAAPINHACARSPRKSWLQLGKESSPAQRLDYCCSC